MKEKECILWLTFWKYRIPIGLCPLCSPSIAAIATFKIVLSQNTHPFPRLSYVCPEPVLAKRSLFVLIKKHRQKGIFRTAQSLQRKFRCQAAARAASCSAARRMPSHLIVIDGRRMHTGGHTTQTYRHKKSAVSERLEHLFSASFLCRNGLVAVEKAAQTVHAANSSQSSPVG